VVNWVTKQKEDKAKWQRDIADAATDVIEPAKNTRKEKADALTQEEGVATGTNNALKEERTKLSTFITETIEPLKQQYTAAVAAASKAAAEFERIKAIKPAAEVEVAAALEGVIVVEVVLEEVAAEEALAAAVAAVAAALVMTNQEKV